MNTRTLLLLLLAALIILFIVLYCVPKTAGIIETDVQQRSTETLQSSGIQAVGVKADGQGIILSGSVANDEIKQLAESLVTDVKGVTNVDNQLTVTSAPSTSQDKAPAAIENQYELTMKYDGTQVILSGSVPDEASRENLINITGSEFGSDNVTDELDIIPGDADSLIDIVGTRLIPTLKALNTGTAVISADALALTGTATSEETRDLLQQSIATDIPNPYIPVFNIGIRQPTIQNAAVSCQKQFSELLGKQKIQFEVNKASINKSSHLLLDKLAGIAADCPKSNIEISGHTDSSGSAAYNQALSQRRAQAVVDYLVGKKIIATRLLAKGFGEAKPIADNATANGMTKNRRIEFKVSVKP